MNNARRTKNANKRKPVNRGSVSIRQKKETESTNKTESRTQTLKKNEAVKPKEQKLEWVLAEISADRLAEIGKPIDSARSSYVLDSLTVESIENFGTELNSFIRHLFSHIGRISDNVDLLTIAPEALDLLERAFSNRGGHLAAVAEAKFPTRGGLRLILDMLTDQFKLDEQEKHINYILKSAMDPLDWKEKVALMEELLKRLRHQLPLDIVSQPAERYAKHYETIVRAYISSIDQVKSILRSY